MHMAPIITGNIVRRCAHLLASTSALCITAVLATGCDLSAENSVRENDASLSPSFVNATEPDVPIDSGLVASLDGDLLPETTAEASQCDASFPAVGSVVASCSETFAQQCVSGRCEGGICGCDDGWSGTHCDAQLPSFRSCAAIAAANLDSGNGEYQIDPDGADGKAPFHVYCDMSFDGGGWTLVRRTTGTAHYPGNDNATGTDARGQYVPNPRAPGIFSLSWQSWGATEFLFATGDGSKWVVLDKTYWNRQYDCISDLAEIQKSSINPLSHSVVGCFRALPEDPWISLHDHFYMNVHNHVEETEEHSMLYGENGMSEWTYWLQHHDGLNVWVR